MNEFLCLLGPIQIWSHNKLEELEKRKKKRGTHIVHMVITQVEIILK